jgi:RNA polymerase sigma factor (sigma-70 family)
MGRTCELGEVISGALPDAIAFHGDLGLSAGAWKARMISVLTKCGKDIADPGAAIFAERLHHRDLYLATCCAERIETAWRRFDALYQKYIQELARCLARNALQALDVGEGLLADLFLPDTTGQSRIGSYDGRSSLATWLHVVVTHRVSNERLRKWSSVERPGDVPEVADRTAIDDLEAGMRAARYGRAIEASLRKACDALSPHDRQMLIWRYQRGLLLEDIAGKLSVHPSTVFRQIERLQVRLRKHVISTLSSSYGFAEEAIAECLREALESGYASVSLLRLIRHPSQGPPCPEEVSAQRRHIA